MSNSATMDAGFLGHRKLWEAAKTHREIDKNHGAKDKSVHRLEQVAKHSEGVFADSPENKGFLSKLFGGFNPKNILFAPPDQVEAAHNEQKAKYALESGTNLTAAQEKQNQINTAKAAKETLGTLRWGILDKATMAAFTLQGVVKVCSDVWNLFTTDQKGTALTNLATDSAGLAINFLPIKGAAANVAAQFTIGSLLPGFLYSIFGGWDANPGQNQPQMAYQNANSNGMPAQSNYLAGGLANSQTPMDNRQGQTLSYCV